MTALRGLAILLLLQATGEALARALALTMPGPVIGLLLLLPALQWPLLRAPVAAITELLLGHLSLLFVPVAVGAVTQLGLLSRYGVQLLVVITLSTWIGIAVTALALRLLLKGRDD
jgi:holin-like protein